MFSGRASSRTRLIEMINDVARRPPALPVGPLHTASAVEIDPNLSIS
jgi:hypothetical protein